MSRHRRWEEFEKTNKISTNMLASTLKISRLITNKLEVMGITDMGILTAHLIDYYMQFNFLNSLPMLIAPYRLHIDQNEKLVRSYPNLLLPTFLVKT